MEDYQLKIKEMNSLIKNFKKEVFYLLHDHCRHKESELEDILEQYRSELATYHKKLELILEKNGIVEKMIAESEEYSTILEAKLNNLAIKYSVDSSAFEPVIIKIPAIGTTEVEDVDKMPETSPLEVTSQLLENSLCNDSTNAIESDDNSKENDCYNSDEDTLYIARDPSLGLQLDTPLIKSNKSKVRFNLVEQKQRTGIKFNF